MITFLANLSQLASSNAFWVSAVSLVLCYLLIASRCSSLKQRAWILTALSSAAMSICSLPLIAQYATARGQLKYVSLPPAATDSIGRFFQAYLIVDLTMGMLFYRSKVNLLTGWIHHCVYIFVVEYAIQGRWSHIFCLAAVMEIPTLVLAMGSIVPSLRSDVFFALCFFATRIALHITLCASLFVQRHQVTNGSFGPALIMTFIFPLHAYWFSGCIKGFFKRAKTERKPTPPKVLNHVASPGTSSPKQSRTALAIFDLAGRPITPSIPSVPASLYASRASLARRRTALRMAVRARWDQLGLWQASGRLREMQRRVRAALPGRERVYQYVGYSVSDPSLNPEHIQGPEYIPEMTSSSFS